MSDWTRGLVSAAPSQPSHTCRAADELQSAHVFGIPRQEIQWVDHQKLTTRVPPGQLLTCPRSKRENQRICFKQGGIFVFPIPPALDRNGSFFFFAGGPHDYSMTQNSDDKGHESVSERNQIQSAPLSQFTDAFLQIKTLQQAKKCIKHRKQQISR